MPPMLKRELVSSPVNRLDEDSETRVQKMDLSEIPLEMAKAQIGGALRKAITRTDSGLKDFGDPSLVKRVCDGDVSTVIARAWARQDTRRELVIALAQESGFFEPRLDLVAKKAG